MHNAPVSRLEAIRRDRRLSAAELAKRVDVTRQTIYAIQIGTYLPNVALALKIARELNATVEQLFG